MKFESSGVRKCEISINIQLRNHDIEQRNWTKDDGVMKRPTNNDKLKVSKVGVQASA